MFNVDDSENIRTMIVNTLEQKDQFERYQIDLYWTLEKLTDFIIEQMNLEKP